MLNADQLRRLARARKIPKYAEAFADAAAKYMPEFGITDEKDVAAAWATFATETGGFRILEENMSYSAKRMMEVWPSRFKTLRSAEPYARNPQKLANKVYGGRLGNKGKPDAGWLYRGSGPIQTTGYVNYKLVEDVSGLPVVSDPDILRQDPDAGMKAACIFWRHRKISAHAKKGDIRKVRRIVNGGYIGYEHFEKYYKRVLSIIKREGFGYLSQASDASVVAAKPVRPSVPSVLKRKDQGPHVAALIERLHGLGFYDGPLDNSFGGGTEAAVRHFQRDAGLRVDGQVGPATRKAMEDWTKPPSENFGLGGGVVYVNQWATRNLPVTRCLETLLMEGVEACFGPGCRAEIYSGGQARKGTSGKRTGSVRHDDYGNGGRAMDVHVYGPDGRQITGLELAALGQWWLAQKIGGVGAEMSGGGIHLDEWSSPPRGGGMLWTYKASDRKPYGRQIRAMLEAGHRGQLPELYQPLPKLDPDPVPVIAPEPKPSKPKLTKKDTGLIGVSVVSVGGAVASWWDQLTDAFASVNFSLMAIVLAVAMVLLCNFYGPIRKKLRGYSTILEGLVGTAFAYFGVFAEVIEEGQRSGLLPDNIMTYAPMILFAWIVLKRFQTKTPVGGQ